MDGGEGDQIILQGDKRQVPFNIRREQIMGAIFLGHTHTLLEEKNIIANRNTKERKVKVSSG